MQIVPKPFSCVTDISWRNQIQLLTTDFALMDAQTGDCRRSSDPLPVNDGKYGHVVQCAKQKQTIRKIVKNFAIFISGS